MRQLQEALRNTGIPVMRGIWRQTEDGMVSVPDTYITYATKVHAFQTADDRVITQETLIYMTMWSSVDPSEAAEKVRSSMFDSRFCCIEESDRGYNQPAYDTYTHQYCIAWTWAYYEDVDYELRH